MADQNERIVLISLWLFRAHQRCEGAGSLETPQDG
jgi:hypothetical protein